MAFCKYCGKEIAEDAIFCKHCGKRILSEDKQQKTEGEKKNKKYKVAKGCGSIIALILIACGILYFAGRYRDNSYEVEESITGDTTEEGVTIEANDTNENPEEYENEIADIEENSSIKIGDVVSYGRFWPVENDYTMEYAYHPVEWEVLDIVDGKALLLSTEILDTCDFTWGSDNESWENSYLRFWCKNFYENAFFGDEKVCICETVNDNSYPTWVSSEQKGVTEDYVFFLSWDELNKYFEEDVDLNSDKMASYHYFTSAACSITDAAMDKGAYAYSCDEFAVKDRMPETLKGKMVGTWWLRSYGMEKSCLGMYVDYCIVEEHGFVPKGGDEQPQGIGCRPAMWVKVDSFFSYYKVDKNSIIPNCYIDEWKDFNTLDDKVIFKIRQSDGNDPIDMKELNAYDISDTGFFNWKVYTGDMLIYSIKTDGEHENLVPLIKNKEYGIYIFSKESFEDGEIYYVDIDTAKDDKPFAYSSIEDYNGLLSKWPSSAKDGLALMFAAKDNREFISNLVARYGASSIRDNAPQDSLILNVGKLDDSDSCSIRAINVLINSNGETDIGNMYYLNGWLHVGDR